MSHSIDELENLDRIAAGYYGISLAGILVVTVSLHWIRAFLDTISVKPYAFRVLCRPVEKVVTGMSIGTVLILPHNFALLLIYVALNVGLTTWKMQWSNLAYLGSRLGWIGLVNMCLVVFLGLKNTPLSPLAGKTYSDLNTLHRFAGYTTIVEIILHASFFARGLIAVHARATLQQPIVYAGAVAGVSMVLIALTANNIFRKRAYEFFYVVHILLTSVILVAVALHQPDIRTKALIIVIVAATLWAADSVWRTFSWTRNGIKGYCTIHPLPQGATKVILSRRVSSRPGDHVLLRIPSLGLLQRHPFSIMCNEPMELVIAARNGFTRRLYKAACANPGGRYRASIEGPYGNIPAVERFNKVLLIAGGSGATFALSLAQEWMRKCNTSDLSQKLHFVWVVKSSSHFDWFPDQLRALRSHPRVEVMLHVTGSDSASKELADGEVMYEEQSPKWSADLNDSNRNLFLDVEKTADDSKRLSWPQAAQTQLRNLFHQGRPVIDTLFERAMSDVVHTDRLLVTGSGPPKLLADIRASTAHHIAIAGPSIRLHIEEFEW